MPRAASAGLAINIIRDVTSRDFSGGLDVADSELNLTSKYARILDNLIVGLDGTLDVRQGTKLFSDIGGTSPIVGSHYFYRFIVPMNSNGEVFAIDGTGTSVPAWNATIAGGMVPPRTIWPGTELVIYGEFNGELIMMNGVDKPLKMTITKAMDYLADLGSGSNVNVPIGNVCATFANHFFIANGYMLNVSERNASGTWLGDIGAQYVNNFDMRPYVPFGDTEILGLYPFKHYLLVAFREVLIPVQIIEDSTATPKLNISVATDSVLNNYGAISSRVGQDIGDLALICDIVGVASVDVNNITRALSPDRPSRLVDPLLQFDLNKLDLESQKLGVFSIYDRKLSAYILFVPNDEMSHRSSTTGYTYRHVPSLKITAWSRWIGGNWHSASRSSEGNIFLTRHNDTKVFIKGDSKINPIYADYVGEQETFTDQTAFTDGTGFTPVSGDPMYDGVPIHSVWELPWSDFKHRGITKTLRYMILDTEGTEGFTSYVFVDDFYTLPDVGEPFTDGTRFTDGSGFVPFVNLPLTPALTMPFIARDAGGYGIQTYGNSPYGGGNSTKLRSLTLTPTKFTTMKLRFEAYTRGPLRFVAITLLYQGGTIRRLPYG
jgi:hypothetical protein